MLRDLVFKNRSYRRFRQDTAISKDTLRELVDLARLSASAGNRQALKFYLACDTEINGQIFPLIGLAGEPTEAEAPTAYIIILGDTRISKSFGCDHGIAAQSILLGATEKGLGGCIVGMIDRKRLRQLLQIPEQYEILLVIALGKPGETPVIDEVDEGEETRGWWDDQGVRHVPKRHLGDLIIN